MRDAMEIKQIKAVVAGDVTVDWLEWPVAARNDAAGATCTSNWRLHEGIRLTARPGGPLWGETIADFVALIKAGSVYLNVGTTSHPSGEIRGQLK
jgi:hypothetical protein